MTAKPARCPNCNSDETEEDGIPDVFHIIRCCVCRASTGMHSTRKSALAAWAKMGAWRAGKVEPRIDYFFAPQQDDQATDWNDRCDYMIDRAYDDVIAVTVVMELGTKWLARIVLSWDEDGETDEWDVLAFDSEAEAKAAVLANKPPKEGE